MVPPAYCWMLGVLMSFTVMALVDPRARTTLNVFEILAIRVIRIIAGVLVLGAPARRPGRTCRPSTAVYLDQAASRPQRRELCLAGRVGARHHVAAVRHGSFALIHDAGLGRAFAVIFLRERLTPKPDRRRRASGLRRAWLITRPGVEASSPAAFLVLGAAIDSPISAITTKKLTGTETYCLRSCSG